MNTLLEEAIDAWIDAREGVIAEVKNFPPAKLAFRPAPGTRSVAELAVHIMEVSAMMTGELTREDTDFHRMPFPRLVAHWAKDVQGLRGKREIVAALERTLRMGVAAFRNAGELHMMQWITRFDGRKGTRLAWFHHGIAQEMYHRGQLATYARLAGLTPALTRRIEGHSSPRGGAARTGAHERRRSSR